MCIFYGYDDRESLGFPIGMKLQVIEVEGLRANRLLDDGTKWISALNLFYKLLITVNDEQQDLVDWSDMLWIVNP